MSIAYTKNFTGYHERNYIISCTISLNPNYININTKDGKKISQNYQMDLEYYQNLTLHNPSCLLAIKKFMK